MTNEKSKVDPAYPSSDGLSSAGEAAMGVLGAAAGLAVPVIGPAVTQAILKRAIKLPLELRRSNWFNSLGEGLRELQDRFEGFDPDTLGENEEFVSTVAETTRIAMATHREEKREALKNAVLNTARGGSIDDVVRGSFLGYIDRFSGLHLRVLHAEANPNSDEYRAAAGNMYMGSRHVIIRKMIPERDATDDSLKRVYEDLRREGLTQGNEQSGLSSSGLFSPNTTPIGDAFLRFISDPPEP
ncbi:hypothetical protein [Methylobacterium thuringiense]|uniref:DUF4393 domain-containing protein n=1 Tax=Methylobacterium thuringiense TaxID=1003091 RepID=A0ABQ4TR11_9HYPH|nr:hypothetical protein [Methylobacterium thuringiense]GJE57309.1 hypothetical protein EKPJFOCH_3823 [Methylobacterium thuringiense]